MATKKIKKTLSLADEIAQRRKDAGAIYEIEIIEGQQKFKFRKEEMLDFLESDFLPDETIHMIYKNYMGGEDGKEMSDEQLVAETVKHFKGQLKAFFGIACHLSVEPKLTMSANGQGPGELPVKLLTQEERFKLINWITKITMEKAEKLRPFRVGQDDKVDKPDGKDVSVPAV